MIVKLTFSTHSADLQPVFTTCGVLLLDKRNHVKVDSKVGMVMSRPAAPTSSFALSKKSPPPEAYTAHAAFPYFVLRRTPPFRGRPHPQKIKKKGCLVLPQSRYKCVHTLE